MANLLLQRATCCVGYVSRVTQGELNLEEKKVADYISEFCGKYEQWVSIMLKHRSYFLTVKAEFKLLVLMLIYDFLNQLYIFLRFFFPKRGAECH